MMRLHIACLVTATVLAAACGEVKTFEDAGPDAPDVPGMVTVTVVLGGAGDGIVISTPSGIDCGSTCTFQFEAGSVVTFSATAAAGSVFSGWGGGCTGTISNCSLTLDDDVAINADFAVATYAVTVVPGGNGTGTISSTPAGIDCPGTCSTMVEHGTAVSLSASAASGSTFLGWSGAGCTGTAPCNLTVTAPVTVDAPFALNNSLVVSRNGSGTGTVTSMPAGINCGTDCDQSYAPGTSVTLTAAPASGSTFAGWSGGGCGGTGTCTVSINAATSVTATFNLSGPGGALGFDGTNDLATLMNAAALNSPNVTVEAWVFVESASGGAAVAMWGQGGLADRYMLRFNLSPAGAPQCTALIAVAGQQTAVAGISLNSWQHVALTYDGATLRQYRNGQQVASLTIGGALAMTSEPVRLGLENIASSSSSYFRGRIDEVRIWNVARTGAQISTSYNRFLDPATPGLVANYHFDEGSGQTLIDVKSGLNGVLGATSGAASDDPTRVTSTAPITP